MWRANSEQIDPFLAVVILGCGILLTFYRFFVFDYYFCDGFICLVLFRQKTNIKFTFIPKSSSILEQDVKHSRTFRTLNLMNRGRYETLLIDRKIGLFRYLVLTPQNQQQFESELNAYLKS